jgi:uncharacterized protein YbbC (DUF1343 family)/CubicO group peptidase (beta-lactamase class C family)
MKAWAWALLLALLPLTGRAQQAPQLDVQELAPVAGIVEAEIAAGHIPGAVVLVGQGRRVVYAQAFGRRRVDPDEPMSLDTIFDLASLTKAVATTPAVLQLVERGKLRLDAPAARYWPAFAAEGKGGITVRQLLSHTSGLPAGIDVRHARRPADVRRLLAAVEPVAKPGGEPLYSDVNFAVLGELVRRVSGQSLATYFARHIARPLGMRDTGFLPPKAKRARIAPTLPDDKGRMRRGRVQDPLAAHLGGVSGNAGLFGSADDLARFARAILDGGVPILKAHSVERMFAPQTDPTATPARGLGWRLQAPLAANRAALPPLGIISHLGYTGTGIWIDPISGVYVIVLSSRLYPDDSGDANPVRARVVAAVADALGPLPPQRVAERWPAFAARVAPYLPKAVAAPVRTGIDVLEARNFAPLQGLRIGLLTNRSGVDAAGRRSIDVLFRAPNVTLAAIFSPEHGLRGNHSGRVHDDTDARTGLPVFSLYNTTRRPTPEMLAGLDAIVVDLQDAGARFYTYPTTLAYVMEAAAERHLKVFVLDRPDPVNGAAVQGPLLDADRRGFTGYWPLPVRPGLTLGEFARLFKAEAKVDVDLTVIPMQGYRRAMWYDDTGLPWLPPSPNLTSLAAAVLYPGVGMVEGAEVSVGRGTDTPFELVGAPWIDGRALAAALSDRHLAGVGFSAAEFTPGSAIYAGERCHGVRIQVLDRDALDTPALGLALAATLARLYPDHFSLDKTLGAIGNQATLDALRAGMPPTHIVAGWKDDLEGFRARRAAYLLYP